MVSSEVPEQRGGAEPYHLSPPQKRCYKIPLSSCTKATFCINVMLTYFYAKSKATPFDDFLKGDAAVPYVMFMVIMNTVGLISVGRDIEIANADSLNGEVYIPNKTKEIILFLVGFLFVSTTIMTPFIAGIVAKLVAYNNVCKNFAIEFQGEDGNSAFMFNGDIIGHFTWEDLDENVLKIGFKANDEVFQKVSPTGLSEMNILIDPKGFAEISGDCYGELSCFSGKINFPYRGSLEVTTTINGRTKEAYNYPSDWFADEFRIADKADDSTISQTLFKPFRNDRFKTCSKTLEDAIVAVTVAKFAGNARVCDECMYNCISIYTYGDDDDGTYMKVYCLSKCSDSCVGIFFNNYRT
jgi:hypothetical protein